MRTYAFESGGFDPRLEELIAGFCCTAVGSTRPLICTGADRAKGMMKVEQNDTSNIETGRKGRDLADGSRID